MAGLATDVGGRTSPRTVDMHIARVREKLEGGPGEPPVIATVRGKGYMLADLVEAETP